MTVTRCVLRKSFSLGAVVVCAACLVVSCDRQKSTSSSNSVGHAQKKLEEEVDDVGREVRYLKRRVKELESAMEGESPVGISLAQEGFSSVKTSVGTLFISCHDVTPYLNGHKLKLWIGNPFVANLSSLKLKYEYGLKEPDLPSIMAGKKESDGWKSYDDALSKYEQSLHKGEIDVSQPLQAGKWTEIELTLVPSTVEELGHVNVLLLPGAVQLNDPPKR